MRDDNGGFTKSDYDRNQKSKIYVTGLGAWRADCRSGGYRECKKEHKGIDPRIKMCAIRADKMVIVYKIWMCSNIAYFHGEKMYLLLKGNFQHMKIKELL